MARAENTNAIKKRFGVIKVQFLSIPCRGNAVKSEKKGVSRTSKSTRLGCEGERKGSRKGLMPYYCNNRNMKKIDPLLVTRSADRFSALGSVAAAADCATVFGCSSDGMVAERFRTSGEFLRRRYRTIWRKVTASGVGDRASLGNIAVVRGEYGCAVRSAGLPV
jgi:hypothetical protein